MYKKKSDYSYKQILEAIKKCNIKSGDTVYVTGNLTTFGHCNLKNYKDLPKVFFKAINNTIKDNGTIIVPTHTFELAKSKKIFDLKKTLSLSGSFSNFILKQKRVIRQIHPYSSSAGVGKFSNYICTNNSINVYGPNSPFARMIEKKTKFISLGMPVNLNCSQVHHAEFLMKVPYRRNKNFLHKIKIGNKIIRKSFKMFVLKEKHLKIKRNKNKIIFSNFKKKHKIYKSKLGHSSIYSYDMNKFFQENMILLKKDIFCWVGKKI